MVISFDYDDTLTMPVLGPKGMQYVARPEYVELAKKHAKDGDDVIIVTARSSGQRNKNEIEAFIKENGLDIKSIHYTNHEKKGPLLAKLKADVHYDDREDHVASANAHGVKGVHVTPIDPWQGVRSALMNGSQIRRC